MRASDTPEVTVIIPTRDRPRILARNLAALAASEDVDPRAVEVIVVDDGSATPATGTALARARAAVPYALVDLRQPGAGQARARNLAMERARGRLWLFLNDDTIPTPHLLAGHLRGHRDHPEPEAGVLGRATLAPGLAMTVVRSLHLDHMWNQLAGRHELDWFHFWTTNVSVKGAFLTRHGLRFDPVIRHVHDDTEMGQRLHEHGFRLYYVPEALGYHDHPLTEAEFLRMAEREAASLAYWAHKRPDTTRALARFGYTPGKPAWERALKYPLLGAVFNPWTEPGWRALARSLAGPSAALARFLFSQCYAARKRRHLARALGEQSSAPASG